MHILRIIPRRKQMKEVTFHLEVFDGPLDLLLHLLSKNKVEIKDIPIAV